MNFPPIFLKEESQSILGAQFPAVWKDIASVCISVLLGSWDNSTAWVLITRIQNLWFSSHNGYI